MQFERQIRIYNPERRNQPVIILGVGSLGSIITLVLAKLGIKNITIIDYDRIEEENISNQLYRPKDLKNKKTEAMKEIIKEYTETEIKEKNMRITSGKEIKELMDKETIIINCLDNLKTKKKVYKEIKEAGTILIDTRMGGELYDIRIVNLQEEEERKEYEKSLDLITTEDPCGMKSIIYTNFAVASEVGNIIKQINNQEKTRKRIIRHMKTYQILGK